MFLVNLPEVLFSWLSSFSAELLVLKDFLHHACFGTFLLNTRFLLQDDGSR